MRKTIHFKTTVLMIPITIPHGEATIPHTEIMVDKVSKDVIIVVVMKISLDLSGSHH